MSKEPTTRERVVQGVASIQEAEAFVAELEAEREDMLVALNTTDKKWREFRASALEVRRQLEQERDQDAESPDYTP